VIAIAVGVGYFVIRDDSGATTDTPVAPTPTITLSPAEVGTGLATP
jgi:hypothetical protein